MSVRNSNTLPPVAGTRIQSATYKHGFTNLWTRSQLNAQTRKITLEVVDANGTPDTSYGRLEIDLHALTGANKVMTIREFHFKDAANGCVEKRMYILATEPETV